MKTRTIAIAAIILLALAACGDHDSDVPTAPSADRLSDTAPVDSTTSRGPGMMGGGL